MNDELKHYGTPRHSGRYPWGSGKNPYQRGISFRDAVAVLKKDGMTEAQIAKAFGLNTRQLRAQISIANNDIKQYEDTIIRRMKEKGVSNVAIGKHLGISEGKVRERLLKMDEPNQNIIMDTADLLEQRLKDGAYIDVGSGSELYLGISPTRMKTVMAVLEERGYVPVQIEQPQATNPGHGTPILVMGPPGSTKASVWKNRDKIEYPGFYSEDGGRTYESIKPPVSVDPSRVGVRYSGSGGEKKDGLIELRPGVEDFSLGGARYAQVRIKVGDDHYLKGMAVYSQDLPKGVDIVFNTNKTNTGSKFDAMKPLESDPRYPFKAIIRQKHYIDKDGKRQQSPLNIVGADTPDGQTRLNEEGGWLTWSRSLSSQVLSKQTPELAKKQLDLYHKIREEEFKDIMALNNPTVRKRLLQSFSDSVDSAANELRGVALPRSASHVILPVNSLKDDEIYAPNYRPGEKVALIRYPHGGIFEIPILTVTDKNKEAKSFMNNAQDAVGINYKVAQQLSGADFDGDTVVVIPNNDGKIKNSKPLKALKNFDPHIYYNPKLTDERGKSKHSDLTIQREMGDVTNLITDMTVKGASFSEIANAVKHSMVVIDAKKHSLDIKRSAQDNHIPQLKTKYQGGANKGASTIISRSNAEIRVPHQKLRSAKDGGPIDLETGELVYVQTGDTYPTKSGKTAPRQTITRGTASVRDARELISTNPKRMEIIYADHANRLKALANQSRKELLKTPNLVYSRAAYNQYKPQVDSLVAKLNVAKKNRPLERRAQLLTAISVEQKRKANPDLSEKDVKKLKAKELARYRERVGAKREQIQITPKEWEAIQAGAVSDYRLGEILTETDLDVIKQYAIPKSTTGMGPAQIARAKAMMANGYTQADIADALGVSTSTINRALNE